MSAKLVCDGCGKEVLETEARGWFSVERSRYMNRLRGETVTGTWRWRTLPDSWHFCSPSCEIGHLRAFVHRHDLRVLKARRDGAAS